MSGRTQNHNTKPELAAQDRERQTELLRCFNANAPRFDDGISDARTVARAVAASCYWEGERSRLARSRVSGIKEEVLLKVWPDTMLDMAAHSVLSQRAIRNQAPAPMAPQPAKPAAKLVDPA